MPETDYPCGTCGHGQLAHCSEPLAIYGYCFECACADWKPSEVTYPIRLAEGFICECGRTVSFGQPYYEAPLGLHESGIPDVLLMCVYCAPVIPKLPDGVTSDRDG